MALLSQHPCSSPGCRRLVRGSAKCPEHSRARAYARGVELNSRRGTNLERGYGQDWQLVRGRHIAGNPVCRCGAPGEIVHHQVAVGDAPELRLAASNLLTLCRACHRREHARLGTPTPAESSRRSASPYPKQLGRFLSEVVVVCGPPASGKSTYAQEHAASGDIVLDLDVIAAGLDGRDTHDDHSAVLSTALIARNDALFLAANSQGPKVWLISSAPRGSHRAFWTARGAVVIPLGVGREECERRMKQDATRRDKGRALAAIAAYFAVHENSP